jgi:hypothetical protein
MPPRAPFPDRNLSDRELSEVMAYIMWSFVQVMSHLLGNRPNAAVVPPPRGPGPGGPRGGPGGPGGPPGGPGSPGGGNGAGGGGDAASKGKPALRKRLAFACVCQLV